tara:strand:- start:298 stop:438 length:141 start_codon:yes stop_codon:yes gene_type:complete
MEYKMRKQITRQQLLKKQNRQKFITEGLGFTWIILSWLIILVLGTI